MAELAKKKQTRMGHKGVVTKKIKKVYHLIAALSPDHHADLAKLTQLKLSLREKLESGRYGQSRHTQTCIYCKN